MVNKVFLCHNRKDAASVKLLAHRLLNDGIEVWLDDWDHIAGEDWIPALERAIRKVSTILVCIGKHGQGPVQNGEVQLALKMAFEDPTRRVIPVLLAGAPENATMPEFLKLKGWVDLRREDEKGEFRALCNGIRGRARHSPEKSGSNPYQGLKPFRENNAHLFFGREKDAHAILKKLRSNRLLTLVGASGSGKSSLVAAGVVPAVRLGELDGSEDWLTLSMRPGLRPCHSLTIELAKLQDGGTAIAMANLADRVEGLSKLRSAMLLQPETLSNAIDLILSDQEKHNSVLLVVDQFEEVFTQATDDSEALAFVWNLEFAVRAGGGRVYTILSLRADFLHKCMTYPRDLAERLVESVQYCLEMDRRHLKEAVVMPAAECGVTIEDGLTEALVDDVCGQPGDLPLLQFTLEELWLDRTGNKLTWDAYERMGFLKGALEKKAEAVFAELTQEDQEAARKILCRMVIPGTGTGDTRRRAPRAELEQVSHGRASRVLELLIRERLVTAHENDLEVAHEALINNWQRLRGWIEDDREGLRVRHSLSEAANEWHRRGGDPGYLFRGARLAQAAAWVERHGGELSGLELDFFRDSTEQYDAERRLSDAAVLDRLEVEAPDIWFDVEAMAEWIGRAQELVSGLGAHRRRLEKLRESAGGSNPVADVNKWCFQDKKTQIAYDTLDFLVKRMETFASGLLSSAEHVARVDSRLDELSILEHATKWEQAIASVRNPDICPSYRGLVLKPQSGLIPIRKNAGSGFWEFLHLATGTLPETNSDGTYGVTAMTGVVLVLLPGDTFFMGAQTPTPSGGEVNCDPLARTDESPVNQVSLEPFFVSKYELTQGQWLRITGRNPSYFCPSRTTSEFSLVNPVDSVDWHACDETLRTVDLQLPTEAQWEYAARAGTTSPWFVGNDPSKVYAFANLLENGAPHHVAVGSYAPNPFGLHDTAGNVWEWCRDYGSYTLPVQPGDGLRIAKGEEYRVFRGGAFLSSPERARSAYRYVVKSDYRGSYVGLRPARGVLS